MLTCEPVLKAPDFSKPFQIAVNASAIGMVGLMIFRFKKIDFLFKTFWWIPFHSVSVRFLQIVD